MIRQFFLATLGIAVSVTVASGCSDDPPPTQCLGFDPQTLTLAVDSDPAIPASQVGNGWLVPLRVSVNNSGCLIGLAHATLVASGGQFSSAASASSSTGKNSGGGANGSAGSSDGGDSGATGSNATDAAATTQGATTTVALTETAGTFSGFATLLLSTGQLSSEVQVSVGDSTACVLVNATGGTPTVGAAGSCGQVH